jgi:endonuclease/exonuclease/phosphatase (EEP) superfamily protein YafD
VTWRKTTYWFGWLVSAGCGWILLSSELGITWPFVTVAGQAFAPIIMLAAWPVLVVAFACRSRSLGAATVFVCLSHVALVAPLVRRDPQPTWAASVPSISIASANVLFENIPTAESVAALAALDVDVIVIVELTPEWVEIMRSAGLLDRFPFQTLKPLKGSSNGTGIFSKMPFVDERTDRAGARNVPSVDVMVGNQRLQIVALHPQAPSSGTVLTAWRNQIEGHGPIVDRRTGPMVLIGDLNSSYLHPPFRRLLSHGLRDAHELMGKGLTFSYPIGDRVPPVTRIDHALITNELAVLSVDEVTIPGSDHRGFVTRLAVQQRP